MDAFLGELLKEIFFNSSRLLQMIFLMKEKTSGMIFGLIMMLNVQVLGEVGSFPLSLLPSLDETLLVGPLPPLVIGLPYDHPHPSDSWQVTYMHKNFGC